VRDAGATAVTTLRPDVRPEVDPAVHEVRDQMTLPPSNTGLRTSAAIVDTAAQVLAQRPDASMNDIAAAAGVGRATLYRYFPSREALLRALAAAGDHELATRIADAGLDDVSVPVALRRLLRAMLTVGDHYVVLISDRKIPGRQELEEVSLGIDRPIDVLFERGRSDGTFRGDLDLLILRQLFGALVVRAIESGWSHEVGLENAAERIASIFLDGVRNQAAADT
jgi:TetR/AcrR family transcriptional repressor of mexCD-oprJ operon